MKPIAAALLLAIPALAAAHELWIERDGSGFAIRQGHRGEKRVSLDPDRVAGVRCRTPEGEPTRPAAIPGAVRAESFPELRVEARCTAVSAAVHHGYWSLTPDGERNLPRTQVAQAVRAWESRAFAKWLDARAAAPAVATPLGDELELVPVTPLGRLRAGDRITVRVLHEGKPTEGAVVSAGHHALGETDRAGEARVRVRGEDLACLGATLRRPLAKPEAEQLVLEASLCFEVAR